MPLVRPPIVAARRALTLAALTALVVAATARPARADATAFIGATLSPANRPVKGVAAGVSLLIVGFEFEYADTSEDSSAQAPSLQTGMANILLQTPGALFGFQPYLTSGIGIYHEALGGQSDLGLGMNAGGGVKIALVGPLRLRLDYRVFRLGSGALTSPAHRMYAGLNLAF
jgi:hypothetical protein